MKYNKLYHMVAALLVVMLLVLTACGSEPRQPQTPNETPVTGPEEIGEIYLLSFCGAALLYRPVP